MVNYVCITVVFSVTLTPSIVLIRALAVTVCVEISVTVHIAGIFRIDAHVVGNNNIITFGLPVGLVCLPAATAAFASVPRIYMRLPVPLLSASVYGKGVPLSRRPRLAIYSGCDPRPSCLSQGR